MRGNRWFHIVGWLAILITLKGCAFLPTPTPQVDVVGTQVAATLTAMAVPSGNATAVPQSTAEMPTPPTEQPTVAPSPTVGPSSTWPTGFWVGNQDTQMVQFYTWPGVTVSHTFNLPNEHISVDMEHLRPVGRVSDGVFLYDDLRGHVLLYVGSSGQRETYADLPTSGQQPAALVALATCPPAPVVAYSYDIYGANYQITSGLAIGTLGSPPVEVIQLNASEGYAIVPLTCSGGTPLQPQTLWFTTRLFGIGNIPVAPTQGLWQADLTTQQPTVVVPALTNGKANHILGVAPTGHLVAYWHPDTPAQVHILRTDGSGQEVLLNKADPTTTFIGYAAFSPDDRFVAWVEYSGDIPTGLQSQVVIYDLSTGQAVNVSNPLPPHWGVTPRAWLNEHTLVLYGGTGQGAATVVWDFQGTAAPTEIPGAFLGVVH